MGDKHDSIQLVVMAWFPVLITCVMIPFSVYLSNQAQFNNDWTILIPFLFVAVFAFLGLFAAQALFRQSFGRIAVYSFFIGVYLAISDVIVPVQMAAFDGTQMPDLIPEPLWLTIVEAGLFVGAIVLAVKTPARKAATFATRLTVLLFLIEIAVIAVHVSPMRGETGDSIAPGAAETPVQTRLSRENRPNIYHVVLDGFSPCVFEESIERLGFGDWFKGFTFFPRNRANYPVTLDSFASYMSGTFNTKGSLTEWRSATNQSGLLRILKQHGYTVHQYILDQRFAHESSSSIITHGRILAEERPEAHLVMLLKIWMLRLGPNILQEEIWRSSSRVAKVLAEAWLKVGQTRDNVVDHIEFSLDDRVAIEVMKRVIQDEHSRPPSGQYTYIHLHLPHPSHHVDRNCSRVPWHTDYREAACCAVRQFVDLLSTLKKLKRLDRSLVILHSDHGWSTIGCDDEPDQDLDKAASLQQPAPADVPSKEQKKSMGTPSNRLRALLAIKPPNARQTQMRVSPDRTQLVNIPSTILSMVGISDDSMQGKPVLTRTPSSQDASRHRVLE
jgi:hypothetical protein